MAHDKIVVVGARENNLKNVTVEIPRDKLVVITGTLRQWEVQPGFRHDLCRRAEGGYVESLSAYARQFPRTDGQAGRRPYRRSFACCIDRPEELFSKSPFDRRNGDRALRLFTHLVRTRWDALLPYLRPSRSSVSRQTRLSTRRWSCRRGRRCRSSPRSCGGRKGTYQKELQEIEEAGYVRVRVDGEMYEVTDDIPMDRYKQHTIEVVVDRLVMKEGINRRLADSIETSLKMGKGLATVSYQGEPDSLAPEKKSKRGSKGTKQASEKKSGGKPPHSEWVDLLFSEHYSCATCGFSMPELEPRMFSFNSPYGACPECTGLGTKTEFEPEQIVTDPSLPLRDGAIVPFVYKSGEVKDWWPEVLDGRRSRSRFRRVDAF